MTIYAIENKTQNELNIIKTLAPRPERSRYVYVHCTIVSALYSLV